MPTADRDRLDALRATTPRATAVPVEMATVTAVEPGDGTPGTAYATVELASGVTTTVYPSAGYLPRVGDAVMAVANGDDLVTFTARTMVDGDMQSRGFVTGESGWRITAAGNLEANDGYFRGRVVTGLAPDPRIEMATGSTEFGVQWAIRYYSGDSDETEPGYMTFAPWGISVRSPIGTDPLQPHSKVEVGAELAGTDTWVNIEGVRVLLSGEVVVNGVKVDDPPRRAGDRSSALVSVASAMPTVIVCNTTYGHALVPGGGDSVAFDALSGAFTPQVSGHYSARITGTWSTAAAYTGSVGFRFAGADIFPQTTTQGHGLGTSMQATWEFQCNGSTDAVQPLVFHDAGASRNFLMTEFRIRRIHA